MSISPHNFGRFFEDFKKGDIYERFPSKAITEVECHLFSLLTMNHHPLHIDKEYAAKTQHGQILVVGTLVFSFSAQESEEAQRTLGAIEQSKRTGLGITLIDGKLVGPPMQKRATSVPQEAKPNTLG